MPWKKITQTELDDPETFDDPETMNDDSMWDEDPEQEWEGQAGQVPCNRCNGVGSFQNPDGTTEPCSAEGCLNGYVSADTEQ